MVVTPPYAAAAVPDSKSSTLRIPPTSASRWVCTSTPPGRTSSPAASISRRPVGSDGASAVTWPPSTPTSARIDSMAVITVPRRAPSLPLLLHRPQHRLVESLDEQPGREALQHDPHVQHVMQIDRAQLAHPGPAVGQRGDQPLGLEDADGFPQRRAADPEQRDQLPLPDPLARLEPSGDDRLPEGVDHPVSDEARVGEADARIGGLAHGWSIVYQRNPTRVKTTLETAIGVSSRAWRGTPLST